MRAPHEAKWYRCALPQALKNLGASLSIPGDKTLQQSETIPAVIKKPLNPPTAAQNINGRRRQVLVQKRRKSKRIHDLAKEPASSRYMKRTTTK
jgi:hypothetical protein